MTGLQPGPGGNGCSRCDVKRQHVHACAFFSFFAPLLSISAMIIFFDGMTHRSLLFLHMSIYKHVYSTQQSGSRFPTRNVLLDGFCGLVRNFLARIRGDESLLVSLKRRRIPEDA